MKDDYTIEVDTCDSQGQVWFIDLDNDESFFQK